MPITAVDAQRRELPREPLRLDQEDAGTTPDEDACNEGAAAAAAEPAAAAAAPAEGAAAAAAPAGGEAPAVAAPAPSPAGKGLDGVVRSLGPKADAY